MSSCIFTDVVYIENNYNDLDQVTTAVRVYISINNC